MRKRARKYEILVRETNKSPEKSIVPPRDKSNDKVIRLDIKSKHNGKSTETTNNQ